MEKPYATLHIQEDGWTIIRIPPDLTKAWHELAAKKFFGELEADCEPCGSVLEVEIWNPLLPEVPLTIDGVAL